jgi:hypothetical protein
VIDHGIETRRIAHARAFVRAVAMTDGASHVPASAKLCDFATNLQAMQRFCFSDIVLPDTIVFV